MIWVDYLTIIPRARMGYESIVQLVGKKNIETKHLSQVKARHHFFFPPKHYKYGGRFSLLVEWAITYSLLVAQPIRTQH